MIELDPGHEYDLTIYDGEGAQRLVFMKREGAGYPYNVGHHPGTNCQEVIRALISRVRYLDNQIPCNENIEIISKLRDCIALFEIRAAHRHGHVLDPLPVDIESVPTNPRNGHFLPPVSRERG